MEEGNKDEKQTSQPANTPIDGDESQQHQHQQLTQQLTHSTAYEYAGNSAAIPSDTSWAVPSLSNQLQQQHFYPFYPESIPQESPTRPYHAPWESPLQYYPLQSLSPSRDQLHQHQQQLELHQQQQHHLEQQQQQQQSPPFRTNYFATPRNDCTIHVAAGKSPTENMNLARKFLMQHEIVYLSAFDAAIVIAIDAALLIQRSRYASIVRVETDTENRVELQQHNNNNHDPPSFASIVKRPQIRITLQRSEEFVQWLSNNNYPALP